MQKMHKNQTRGKNKKKAENENEHFNKNKIKWGLNICVSCFSFRAKGIIDNADFYCTSK